MNNYHSSENQEIVGKFVNREINCCLTAMVEELISCEKIDIWEYLEPYAIIDGEELTQSEAEELKEKYENFSNALTDRTAEIHDTYLLNEELMYGMYENDYSEYVDELKISDIHKKQLKTCKKFYDKYEKIIDEIESADFDKYPEIFEYWSVSDWFAEKLKAKGQIIIEDYGHSIWGRQTTGQAILLDYVVCNICNDMEILTGQANSWGKTAC